ncbi:hypothetical protein YC2023_061264 [Brassica napus]
MTKFLRLISVPSLSKLYPEPWLPLFCRSLDWSLCSSKSQTHINHAVSCFKPLCHQRGFVDMNSISCHVST